MFIFWLRKKIIVFVWRRRVLSRFEVLVDSYFSDQEAWWCPRRLCNLPRSRNSLKFTRISSKLVWNSLNWLEIGSLNLNFSIVVKSVLWNYLDFQIHYFNFPYHQIEGHMSLLSWVVTANAANYHQNENHLQHSRYWCTSQSHVFNLLQNTFPWEMIIKRRSSTAISFVYFYQTPLAKIGVEIGAKIL